MGFGPAAALGVAASGTKRPVIALVGDGAFGSNPSVVATAVEMGVPVVWLVMNNGAFGTIAGLQRKHYGTGYGCEFQADGEPYSPDFAALARACGAAGVRIGDADELQSAIRDGVRFGPPNRHRCADAQHAGDDARRMGHRADLPVHQMSANSKSAEGSKAHQGDERGTSS